jgi:diadenosine tetraphosphatase ApaH/serine/threonine PP2A family protein phosphatase
VLTEENRLWLEELPEGPLQLEGGVVLSHGSPAQEDAYVFESSDVLEALNACAGDLVFFGHTHLPVLYELQGEKCEVRHPRAPVEVCLEREARRLVNPGAVGQPRDGNPAAAYGLVDLAEGWFEFCRATYDVVRTQQDMAEAGLPSGLADRLSTGS